MASRPLAAPTRGRTGRRGQQLWFPRTQTRGALPLFATRRYPGQNGRPRYSRVANVPARVCHSGDAAKIRNGPRRSPGPCSRGALGAPRCRPGVAFRHKLLGLGAPERAGTGSGDQKSAGPTPRRRTTSMISKLWHFLVKGRYGYGGSWNHSVAEKLGLLLICLGQKTRPRRNLLAGPFVGEFGYE